MKNSSAATVSCEMIAPLPEPVRRYLEFSGVAGKPLVRSVTVKQTGRIRQSPEKPWMPFRAIETYSLDPPGFIWQAKAYRGRFPILTVRDSYVEGRGGMRVRLAGIFPIVNASGPELDHSSAVRFLNEMIWFPSGYLRPYITWTAIDDTSAEVSLTDPRHGLRDPLWPQPTDRRPGSLASGIGRFYVYRSPGGRNYLLYRITMKSHREKPH